MDHRATQLRILIAGTVLSVVAAGVSYIGGPRDVVLSVVVGLQVEALVLLLEVIFAVQARERLAGRAARLMQRIEQVPGLDVTFDELSQHLSTIQERYRHTIAPAEANRIVDQCNAELRDLSIGHLFRDSYDPTLKMDLLAQGPDTLRTTSIQTFDLAWHWSEVGRAYWTAQREALSRGWQIERIFIYDEWVDDLDVLAREQLAAGVAVRRISARSVPKNLLVDFSLWGNRYAYEQWIRRTEGLPEDRFSLEPSELDRYRQMWAQLHAISETVQG